MGKAPGIEKRKLTEMIEITEFIKKYMAALDQAFPDRVWFAGLQGSYGREEATEASDIDMVGILDQLSASDIHTYDAMLDTLPCRELICGFLSGRQELENWEPSELFQFCRDTTPIRGSLDHVLSSVTSADIARAIKSGACGVYHGCVHNMLYEKSEDILKGLYKSASFVLQAVHFQRTGVYVRHMADLVSVLPPEESAVLQTFMELKNGGAVVFDAMSEQLFSWAGKWAGAPGMMDTE